MPQTIYASFNDANLAERAAGALMDHGVLQQDISLVSDANRVPTETNASTGSINSSTVDREAMARNEAAVHDTNYIATTSGEGDITRGASNLGDGMVDATKSTGNRVAQAGDRTFAAVSGAVGADTTAARYDSAADDRAIRAEDRSAMARNEDTVHGRTVDSAATTVPLGATEYDRRMADNAAAGSASYDNAAGDTIADDTANESGITTTTGGDAAAGAAKGASIGLGLGILGGLASLLIPGVGFVTGMGALATAIGAGLGTTAAGAITGGVFGFLKDQGVDESVAQDYQNAINNGGALLSVHVPSGDLDGAAVQDLLNKYGAANVRSY